jgi:hypothetical protein
VALAYSSPSIASRAGLSGLPSLIYFFGLVIHAWLAEYYITKFEFQYRHNILNKASIKIYNLLIVFSSLVRSALDGSHGRIALTGTEVKYRR